jgi:hypothetical protein
MYMMELSLASMQCTYRAAIKLFCRYFDLMTIEPSSVKSRRSRPWDGRPQSELHVNFDVRNVRLSRNFVVAWANV